MALPPLKPGDLPKPWSRKERKRLSDAEELDMRTQLIIRPHVVYRRDQFDRCAESQFGVHKFTGNRGATCSFCSRHFKDCLLPKGD